VFAQAFVERMAAISTLASLRVHAHPQAYIPQFMREWGVQFLVTELIDASWWKKESRIGPDHFVQLGMNIPKELQPKDDKWAHEGVWQTQVTEWRMHHVAPETAADAIECWKLFRDGRTLPLLEKSLQDNSFRVVWASELLAKFGFLPEILHQVVRRENEETVAEIYRDYVGFLSTALKQWSAAASWDEYIELASFVPFLRLFERDADVQPLLGVITSLIRDYGDVWRDSDNASNAYDSARRFLVVVAAMDLFLAHQRGEGCNEPCVGPAADAKITAALKRSARSLLSSLDQLRDGHAKDACRALWEYVRIPPTAPPSANYAYEEESAHPLIVTGMVRFMVRLLYVHSLNSLNVLPGKQKALTLFHQKILDIFMNRHQRENHILPLGEVTELWALQYRLSEYQPSLNYQFDLADAVAAAGWGEPSQ
jgi:hypothetical protein